MAGESWWICAHMKFPTWMNVKNCRVDDNSKGKHFQNTNLLVVVRLFAWALLFSHALCIRWKLFSLFTQTTWLTANEVLCMLFCQRSWCILLHVCLSNRKPHTYAISCHVAQAIYVWVCACLYKSLTVTSSSYLCLCLYTYIFQSIASAFCAIPEHTWSKMTKALSTAAITTTETSKQERIIFFKQRT